MPEVVNQFSISLRQVQDYEFVIKLGQDMGELLMDETPPLGKGKSPSPTRTVAAAIAGCLSASLLFASRKAGIKTGVIETEVTVDIVRNENRRMRIGAMHVTLDPK